MTSRLSFWRWSTSGSLAYPLPSRPLPPVSAEEVGCGAARPSRASRCCSSSCRRFFSGTYSSYLGCGGGMCAGRVRAAAECLAGVCWRVPEHRVSYRSPTLPPAGAHSLLIILQQQLVLLLLLVQLRPPVPLYALAGALAGVRHL